MRYCWHILLLRLLATAGSSTASEDSRLADALVQVVVDSEMGRFKTLYVYTQATAPAAAWHLEELLSQILVRLPATLLARRLIHRRAMQYKPYVHGVLLLVDDLPALAEIYGGIRATQDLSHTLVYMSLPTDPFGEEVHLALQLLWRLSVLNVGVILRPPGGSQFVMLSYFPFSATHGCQVISASVLNRFQVAEGRWSSGDYFPVKLGNFHGCLLTCATWEDMPYLVWRPSEGGSGPGSVPGSSSGSFVGIEGALLQFMADNLNFSVGLYWMNKDEVLATFDESGSIFDEVSLGHFGAQFSP